ncbi:MAG: hypothetical protein AUK44_08680 [Porphyromonadaceae bacterium CG2_30_38_12]|nr:MAG: hypothetical protein AUK44_08680 [Porphyromonadaceae bacterium CG2_30_38_12]
MKRIYFYAIILLSLPIFITSCEKDPIGGTATEAVAGEWYVTAAAIDANGVVVDADWWGVGRFHLDTYNTSANTTDSMWVNDHGNLWDFNVKVGLNLSAKTFSGTDLENVSYVSKVTITDGKILLNAAKTPSGAVADSIVFNVTFSDDTDPAQNGFVAYRVSGYRYTGLTNDN